MLREWKIILSIAVFLVAMPLDILASEKEHGGHEEYQQHRNRMELFLGNTHEHGEDGFTVGLSYGYLMQEFIGVGGTFEYAAGHFDKWSVTVPVFMYPYGGWRFALAPGLEHREGENDFLFRVGVAYEFEIGRSSIIPEFDVDFVDGEKAYVYGLSFGWGF
jgi:hypothetical protein